MNSEPIPIRALSRERDPHPAVLVLAACILLLAAGGLLHFVESEDHDVVGTPASFDAPREKPAPPAAGQGLILTDLDSILGASDQTALQGREVALRGVPVQAVVGDFTFWIGPSGRQRVPVALLGERTGRQSELQTVVREGQRVDVFGVVRLLSEVGKIDESWALDARDREQLRQAPIYVSALRVDVVRQ